MGDFRVSREMPFVQWRNPAIAAEVYARCTTPLGEVTLIRERGPRTRPEDHADAVESWTVSLRDGEATLKVHRLVPEPLPMRWRIWRGCEGDGLFGTGLGGGAAAWVSVAGDGARWS